MKINRKLTPSEKAAVLLITLGEELASELLRGLPAHNVRSIVEATARLGKIDEETATQVQKDFQLLLKASNPSLQGGRDVAQKFLKKSFGDDSPVKLTELGSAVPSAFADAEGVESGLIHKVLEKEAPQTAALILAHFSAKKAAEVLSMFDSGAREEVLVRMTQLTEVSTEVLDDVAESFAESLNRIRRISAKRVGGIEKTAAILATMKKTDRDTIIEQLNEKAPGTSREIQTKLWTFEDLSRLDKADLQTVVRLTSQIDLEIALRRASDTLKTKFYSAMSRNKADEIRENVALAKPVAVSKIDEAQRRMADLAKDLIEKGQLRDPSIEAV